MRPVDGAADGGWVSKIARRVEGWALALALAAGGAIVGFAYSEYRLHQVVVDLREAQREEITRLTDVYARNLGALTPKVEQAAQVASAAAAVASSAAVTANSAAEAAADAADTSAGAAKTAKSAAVTAARRPAIAVVASSVAQPTPSQLGLAVDLANRKVKEAAK
ncbi:hypothetical protein LMG24238_03007 [Paraburkholderia sediminicola]|uniref:Uncharacterized protein n=1 Tax=Paraburkholderia sediminicola TaxID=458836 RepID=A0A6J5B2A8_9BURK|nr:hypothetical protein [Paraburkholderia sediminicola]CAB3688862.1 hypothetical protein LMG24238_03007 [Paraburkholderia sediminicola]